VSILPLIFRIDLGGREDLEEDGGLLDVHDFSSSCFRFNFDNGFAAVRYLHFEPECFVPAKEKSQVW
jgi:hypothetical protein